MNDYLKNLPKSDDNEELQQLSLKALKFVLPTDKFLLRDERVDDKGVDASLEVKSDYSFTNFRSQIQLKGTYSNKENKDKSISYSVKTNNLNYLLNNPISLYILYIHSRNEFRFVWAKEEQKRLNETTPDWQSQTGVTLKFSKVLNDEKVNEIYEQIVEKGSFHRKINEVFNSNPESKFKIELNPSSLEITDPQQAKDFLIYHNVELLNAGFENLIIEKFNLLTEIDKKDTNLLLLKAAAENRKGNYKTALDTLGLIELLGNILTEKQRQFFEMTENSCNWKIGVISNSEYNERLKNISETKIIANPLLDKLNYLSHDFRHETHEERRIKKLKELESLVNEILTLDKISEKTKIGIQVTHLGCESENFLSDYSYFYLGAVRMLAALSTFKSVYLISLFNEIQLFNERNSVWYEKANNLLKTTDDFANQAEIGQYDVRHWLYSKRLEKFFYEYLGQNLKIPLEEIEDREKRIKTVIEIYTQLGKNYEIVQAKNILAELLSFAGRFNEAEELRQKNNAIAEKMSYKNLIVEYFMEDKFKEFLNKHKS